MKMRNYRKPPKNEAQLEERVRDWCKDNGIKRKKMSSPGSRATLDDLFHFDGKTLWIEMKHGKNTPTENQWDEIDDLREHGIEAYWANTLEQVVGVLTKSPGWYETLPPQDRWAL